MTLDFTPEPNDALFIIWGSVFLVGFFLMGLAISLYSTLRGKGKIHFELVVICLVPLVAIFVGINLVSGSARHREVLQSAAEEHYGLKLTPEEASALLKANNRDSSQPFELKGTTLVQDAQEELTLIKDEDTWKLVRLDSLEEYAKNN